MASARAPTSWCRSSAGAGRRAAGARSSAAGSSRRRGSRGSRAPPRSPAKRFVKRLVTASASWTVREEASFSFSSWSIFWSADRGWRRRSRAASGAPRSRARARCMRPSEPLVLLDELLGELRALLEEGADERVALGLQLVREIRRRWLTRGRATASFRSFAAERITARAPTRETLPRRELARKDPRRPSQRREVRGSP